MASNPVPGAPVEPTSARKTSTRLMVLSSAAVVAVYGAGFWKTKAAAERLDAAEAARRPAGRGGAVSQPVSADAASAAARGSATPATPAAVAPESQPPAVSFTLPTVPARDRREPAALPAATAAAPSAQPASDTRAAASTVASTLAATGSPAEPTATQNVAPPVEPALPAAPAQTPAAPPAMAATANLQQSAPAPAAPKPQALHKDGEYLGWGTCRHGDIQAKVVVSGGRITSATIAQCWTRYSCNWLDPVVPQVVQRQSPNIDYVSGATQSVDAFYWAVIDALSKAK